MKDTDTDRPLELMTGNHAVAMGVKLAHPDVAPLYPITPQTPILEKLTELQSLGEFEAEILTPESEHSAMAACISASVTGVRVFTATSSQGLLLMHELLHYAAGARSSIVLFNVNRTPASPWGFWPDQLDSLAQRDTGWVQLYSENPQESLDLVIGAFRVAEAVHLPVMVSHDAFYVSHALEPVELPPQEVVDAFLPPFAPDLFLDPEKGLTFGAPVDQKTWNLSRRRIAAAMAEVPKRLNAAGRDWHAATGRGYGAIESYRAEGAEVLFLTMGSLAGTAREAVDRLRDDGICAGLVKLRLFRPFPVAALRAAVAGKAPLLVLDRNYSPGCGGITFQEVKAALGGTNEAPPVHGFLTGVGGVNVSVDTLCGLARDYRAAEPAADSIWVE